MKQFAFFALPFVVVAGCTELGLEVEPETPVTDESSETVEGPMTAAPPPPSNATTVEDFDTTTAEDREEAQVINVTATETALGTTIASLGSPTEPGIWLKTPLVSALTPGRVEYQGKEINIELRPSGGAPGSGSQISLAAMRLIEAPLTGLPEIAVFGL